MYDNSLTSVTAEVETLLVDKLAAKGRNLKEKINFVGRSLPRRIRSHAKYLVDAEVRFQNPKLAHQYDPKRLLAAQKHCVSYLEKIDRKRHKSFNRTAILVCTVVNLTVLAGILTLAYNVLYIG